ncbi:MAG: hypothetical protein ABMA02_06670 [Saprospiraceae bacterium]
MKSLIEMLAFAVAILFVLPAQAQDDLYYDPSTDGTTRPQNNSDNYPREDSKITQRYDDEYYDEEDDYAYEYSSRIRRFHRPARVVDYYDPFFVDMWMYDPFYSPGTTIYLGGYNDFGRWRRWQRWNRWNSWSLYNPYWGGGFNNWGWNVSFGNPWGWNTWGNPYVWNNYYYDPYWVWNGYNPYYCPQNVWANNNYYWNNNNGGYNDGGYSPKTYSGGVRRTGTTVNPGYARMVSNTNSEKGDRLAPVKAAPTIDLGSRTNSRIESTTGDRRRIDGIRDVTPDRDGRRTREVAPDPNTRRQRDITPENEQRPTREVTSEPRTRRERDVTPVREDRPTREVTPERERPVRDVAPDPGTRRERDVTPAREPRPTRRDDSSYEPAPNRREMRESRNEERPGRSAEPTQERSTRSFDTDRSSSQPSRSTERSSPGGGGNDSGSNRSSAPASGGDNGRSRRGN